jgi:drug/metabolite transporter (DMT)-like permease
VVVVGYTSYSGSDGCAKYLAQYFPMPEIVIGRSFFLVLFALTFVAFFDRPTRFDAIVGQIDLNLAHRAFWESLVAPALIFAFAFMPLANVIAIYSISPIISMLAGKLRQREIVPWWNWAFAALAFTGAVIVTRPAVDQFGLASLIVVLATFAPACRDILTRRVAVSPSVSTVASGIASLGLGMVLALAWPWLAPAQAWQAPGAGDLLFVALAAAFVTTTYFLNFLAIQQNDLSKIAPFRYAHLASAVVVSMVFFRQFPDLWTWVGIALIGISGSLLLTLNALRRPG